MACRHAKVYKLSSIIGAVLLLMPVGVQWYWGNLSVYVLSLYHGWNSSVTGSNSSWVISLLLIFRGIFFILSGYLIRRMGTRMTLFVGILTFNVGVIGTYFVLQYSIALFYCTFGILCGVGFGLVYGTSLAWAIQWAELTDVGLITSIVQSGYPLGAILINQFVTMYLNPHNVEPDTVYKGYKFFTQVAIVNRIPSVFLMLAFSFFTTQIIGLLMLKENETPKLTTLEQPVTHLTATSSTTSEVCTPVNDGSDETQNLSPKEMASTLAFYILAITFLLNYYAYLIVTNYYKLFGQLWIRDDFFLTYLGIAIVIFNVPSRLICGVLTDKFGVKNTLVGGFSIMCVNCAFMPITPRLDRWLYCLVTTVLACITGSMINVYTVATLHLFGPKFAITNFGWVNSVTIIVFLSAPPLMELLVAKWGWCALFFSGAFTSLVNVLLVIKCLPNEY